MTGSTPYTPAQILDMGRRAEQQGNLDYAAQFYTYLTESFPGTREAAEAQAGVERVYQTRERFAEPAHGGHEQRQPAAHETSAGARAFDEVPRTGPPSRGPHDPSASPLKPSPTAASQRPQPSLSIPAGQPAPRRPDPAHPVSGNMPTQRPQGTSPGLQDSGRRGNEQFQNVMHQDEDGEEHVEYAPGYRIGRFLAFALVLLGWLAFIGGIAFAALAIVGITGTQLLTGYGGLPIGAVVGLASIVAGIALVFVGSLAQAAFEAANNTRELLEIERAKIGW